jgi:oligopeptide/dipeptide ABC transporter ATP-binding protein
MPVSASSAESPRSENVIEVRDLVKYYPIQQGIVFRKQVGTVHAVDGITFDLKRGTTLAIVGESGCGKSTVGRLLMGLEPPTSGIVRVEGVDLASLSAKKMSASRRDLQIILQDPYTSLDPRMTVGAIIGEPFDIHPNAVPAGVTRKEAVRDLMDRVGLNPEFINRYPHQFSGGQRQRIGIARALALRPKVIIADEPVSALDVSVQAQVMNLLMDLRDDLGLSYVFISHDLAVVRQIADTIAVMYLGQIVEYGPAEEIYSAPTHPYTAALLSAVPVADPVAQRGRERILLTGDLPSPADPPPGCRFNTRCFQAQAICTTVVPPLLDQAEGHLVACHFPLAVGTYTT